MSKRTKEPQINKTANDKGVGSQAVGYTCKKCHEKEQKIKTLRHHSKLDYTYDREREKELKHQIGAILKLMDLKEARKRLKKLGGLKQYDYYQTEV